MTQSTIPAEILEKQAAEQRRSLHDHVQHLRMAVKAEVRERTNIPRHVRRHFLPIAGAVAVIGLSAGYSLAGIFTGE